MVFSLTSLNAAIAVSICLVVYLAQRLLSAKPSAPLPPGPRGLPLIGNVLDWPKEMEWQTFAEWGKRYGDLIHCNLLGQHIVILNSPELAFEMLDKKGTIYSSRPSMYVGCELVGWKKTPVMAPHGDDWRTMRRMLTREIGSRAAIARFEPMQACEVHKFVRRVLATPAAAALPAHIRTLAAAVILSVSHGYTVGTGDDAFVRLAERTMADGDRILMPGAFLVDVFPAIDRLPLWFPGTGYRKVAAEALVRSRAFHDIPHAWVKEQLAQGTARPSFVATQLTLAEGS